MKAKERAGINQSGGAIKYLGREPFVILASPLVMRVRTFLFITALMLCHPQLWTQTLTKQFPSAAPGSAASGRAEQSLAANQQTAPSDAPLPDESLPNA